ncbi:hypothetical protein [Luteolibacter sp. AS25]|uniref:hypothetical protein n=1 Tax=Luteolibacter sp. AS25 TaxID=3135776 RepID=UPI00398B735B
MFIQILADQTENGGSFTRNAIFWAIVANFLTQILMYCGGRFVRKWIASSTPTVGRIWIWSKPVIFTIIFVVTTCLSFASGGKWQTFWIAFTVGSAISSFWFLYYPTIRLANAGIVGIDSHISKGIDYKKSLNLCKNDLFFLGVGAAKLNENPKELEAAIRRSANPANPVKFLLCSPTSPQLAAFASRAGVDKDTYSRAVEASIKSLKNLRDEKNLNIEIRLYNASSEYLMPKFRLMFINGDVCLMSYTIFGEGLERNLPQYWIRQWQGKGDKTTLYYALNMYFEQLWMSSKIMK